MSSDGEIEYFYAAHSAYAYLGAWALQDIADATGWRIRHRPFDFLPVMTAAGGQPFRASTPAHIGYFFGRELIRWAEWRGLPILRHRPTHHDNPLDLANGMIIASADPDPLSRALLQAHWRDDADLADPATLTAIAGAIGQDGPALLAAAASDPVRARHRANTDEAIQRGVFGSPCYFVRGDMFYGQDRLDHVARAIARPFAP